MVRKNIPEVTKACLKTITAYADNIIKVCMLELIMTYIFQERKTFFADIALNVFSRLMHHCFGLCSLQDPLERKYQSIKITNAHLRQSVLQASGGLQLLCFGPAAFRLALSTTGVSAGQYVLQSAVAAEVLVVDKSALFRATYVSWLRKYVQVLKAVVDKL